LRKIGGVIAGAAAVGSILAGLAGYWTTYRTVTKEIGAPAKPAPTEAAHLSIVALPFTNLSGDPSCRFGHHAAGRCHREGCLGSFATDPACPARQSMSALL
jgi:hypothetical protein